MSDDNLSLFVPKRDSLLAEREKTHGKFADNATTWDKLCNVVMPNAQPLNSQQWLALSMIFLKIARMIQNPNEQEHWKDVAGYAKLGAEACKNEKASAN